MPFPLSANSLQNSTIFHSSANPDPTKVTTIAAGSDFGAFCLNGYLNGSSLVVDKFYETRSTVFSVAWLSSDVFSAGCRNGAIWLYDLRSGGRIQRIRHPSTVTHLRKADDLRLVVAGLQNNVSGSLFMYQKEA